MKTLTRNLILGLCASLFFVNQLKASEPLKSGFTIKLAYIMPQSGFGELPFPLFPYKLKTTKSGFGLQLGKMYFINAIDLGDKFKIGIDVTWISFSYHSLDYIQYRTYPDIGEFPMYYLIIDAGVGPSFSYSPVEKMALDVSFKIAPTFAATGGNYSLINGDSETLIGRGSSLRFTPAFYFRYSALLVGIEYNIGSVNMKYEYSGFDYPVKDANIPLDALRLVLGVKF